MKVLQRKLMPDKTKIQIENWTDDYLNLWIVGAYPVATKSGKYSWIKQDKTFRLSINFDNKNEAEEAFNNLFSGKKSLIDYKDSFHNSEDFQYLETKKAENPDR